MTISSERRARIRRDSAANAIWIALLILQALSLIGLIILVGSTSILSALLLGSAAVTGLTLIVGGIMAVISVVLWWGIWSLAAWVRVLLWVVALLGMANLFNGQYWTGVMPILIAVGYTWLLRLADPASDSSHA